MVPRFDCGRLSVYLLMTIAFWAYAGGAVAAGEFSPRGVIHIVVGFPPGGTADAVARLYGEQLQARLQTTVVVENRPGAGGRIAAEAVARHAPDDKTLLLAIGHMMSTLPLASRSVKYDPMQDFSPVSLLGTSAVGLAVHGAVEVHTVAQWAQWARRELRAQNFGISAHGSPSHLIGHVIAQRERLPLNAVPYRGGAPLVGDLLSGEILVGIDALGSFIEHHHHGRLRVIAVSGTSRVPQLPTVQTFSEQGYHHLDRSTWLGLFAPRGSSAAFVQRVVEAVAEAARNPRLARDLARLGVTAHSSTPDELRGMVLSDLQVWAPVVRSLGFHED